METLEQHVKELRKRIVLSVTSVSLLSIGGYLYSQRILSVLQGDLGFTLHALTAYETFYTRIMIALIIGTIGSLPFLLHQLLMFMKPGLKEKEYRILRNYIPFSIILFALGAGFGYRFVVKASLTFFQQVTQSADVGAVWGLKNTLGYALKLSVFTGIMFQLPIVSVILSKADLIDAEKMKTYRGYFIVVLLILSAVATPPDIISQLLLTVPMIGLYQLSIFLVSRS